MPVSGIGFIHIDARPSGTGVSGMPWSPSSTLISSVSMIHAIKSTHLKLTRPTDTTGTLYSMAKFAGLRDPVTLDFENSTIAYCVDAFSISMGALMGTSPVTAFIESATGISEGGKTGITAIVTGLAFFVSVFFAPIFASIPAWATGGALVIVGSLMIRK